MKHPRSGACPAILVALGASASVVGFSALVSLGGCGGQPESPITRLLDDAGAELFMTSTIATLSPVFRWQFHDDPVAWLGDLDWLGANGSFRAEPRGLVERASLAERTAVTFPAQFAAATVDAVVLTVRGMRGARAELHWTAAGETSDAHVVELPEQPPGAPDERRFEFRPDANPLWIGQVSELRFVLINPRKGAVVLRSVEGLEYALAPDRLREAVGRAWRVSLDNDTRTALLAPPGLRVERAVTVPRSSSRLRLAYGRLGNGDQPVGFTVAAERADGARLPLFAATLAADTSIAQWQQATVALDAIAGETVTLVFETSTATEATSFDLLADFPIWGHPEIVASTPTQTQAATPSVVLISIDTLRADHLSLYGYGRKTSPKLDAWAARTAVTFDRTVVQAPWTLPSHASMLSGIEPLRHGANHQLSRAPDDLDMLAEVLRDAGYATAAVTGGGYLHPRYGFTQGHGSYHSSADPIGQAVDRAIATIDELSPPFYLFFHTYEVHAPYNARTPWFEDLSGRSEVPDYQVSPTQSSLAPRGSRTPLADQSIGVDMYDSGIAFMDSHIARLLDRLDQPDLAGRALVVFTSDHGEALGDPAYGHGHLWDNNLLVPMVIAFPDHAHAGTHISRQVRSIDLFPTLLASLGLAPRAVIDGVSLLPLLDGSAHQFPATATSYASKNGHGLALRVDDRVKYVRTTAATRRRHGNETIYDLGGDPGERRDVSADHPQLERLRTDTRERFDRAEGLRLRLSNASAETLRGTLDGGGITEFTVTSIDLDCECLTIDYPGRAFIELPPGASFTLHLELVEMDELAVELDLGDDRRSGPLRLPVARLEGHAGIVEDDTGWRLEPSLAAPVATGVEIWWQGGRRPQHRAGDGDSDPELAERLRALGYLN